jgi:hypothetical protein
LKVKSPGASSNNKKKKKKSESGDENSNASVTAAQPAPVIVNEGKSIEITTKSPDAMTAEERTKRIKNLRKKIKGIEEIKKKIEGGVCIA